MTVALIDGDMAIHMACAGEARQVDWGDGNIEHWVDADEAYTHARLLAESWRGKTRADAYVFCLSSDYNFRKWISPFYKANRTGPKPETLEEVRARIETNDRTCEIVGLEADDVMGILATEHPSLYVIASRDKDMQTIPARVFNPDKNRRPIKITKDMANRAFMRQVMQGDPTDGFSGIPKIGPAKAQEILQDPRRLLREDRIISKGKNKGQTKTTYKLGEKCGLWQAMVDRVHAVGMSEDYLINQARLARILRAEDYDEEKGQIRLWHPREDVWMPLDEIIDNLEEGNEQHDGRGDSGSDTVSQRDEGPE